MVSKKTFQTECERLLKNSAKGLVLKLPYRYTKPDLVENICPNHCFYFFSLSFCFQVAANSVFIRSFSIPSSKGHKLLNRICDLISIKAGSYMLCQCKTDNIWVTHVEVSYLYIYVYTLSISLIFIIDYIYIIY